MQPWKFVSNMGESVMKTNKQPLSGRIADYALNLKYEDIPADVIAHVKLLMMDTFGCIMPSMHEAHVPCVYRAIEKMPNRHEATLWGTTKKVTIDHAVMYNGCLIHGQDFDDTHAGAIIHPSASVLNTAVALGEMLEKSGEEILTAMVAAYEVLLRLGEACKGKLHEHYFHPTGIFAPFAAICIACRFYGIGKDVMMNTMGLAGNFVGTMQQYTVDGTWSKKLHPGWGIHAGLYALRFAQEGYIGSPEIFEGTQAIFNAHIGTTEYIEPTFADLGKRWITKEVAFKFYPVCHMMHSHLDILQALMVENGFIGSDIQEIHAVMSPRAAQIVALPPERKKHPENDYLMRFSIQYSLAMTAVQGQLTMRDVDMKWLDDPEVAAMIERVTVESEPEADVVGHFPGDLTVTLKDGRTFHRNQKYETGSKENPAKRENVLAKFNGNVQGMISTETATRLLEKIEAFETLANVNELIELLKV